MGQKEHFSDPMLNSLWSVYQSNPKDLAFKKYLAIELYNRGELSAAYPVLIEIFEYDKDIAIERAINEIESKIDIAEFGFGSKEVKVADAVSKLKRDNSAKITFAHVAGMEHIKDAIRTDIIYPLQHPELAKTYKMKVGGGILMYGPPGCGKTFIAKATAGEINATFFHLSIHEVISAFTGEGEKVLHAKFEQARKASPSVMFFDEIDALAMSRGKTGGNLRTLVNQFLEELDGLASNNEGMLVIGATNLPWEVDVAFRRPGRFDKVLFVPPPDEPARARMFQLSLAEKPCGEIDFQHLATLTADFSSADVGHVCAEAGDASFKRALRSGKVEPITQEILEETIKRLKPSTLEWLGTAKSYVEFSNQAGLYDDVAKYLTSRGNR